MTTINTQLAAAHKRMIATQTALALARMTNSPLLVRAKVESINAEIEYGRLYEQWRQSNPGTQMPDFI